MQVAEEHESHWLTPDLEELLARSTEVRHGLAFVHRAPPEHVAVSLGVHAETVDRARDYLERAHLRAEVIREYARLLERPPAPPPPATAPGPVALGPEELIQAAARHPLGVRAILCAPLETLAILFGVHPDVAAEARELLERRGAAAEGPDAEE